MVNLRQSLLLGVEDAFLFHKDQTRKGSDIPYVSHLLGVASLILEDGGTWEQVIAGLLHDAIEDAGGTPTFDYIRRTYGPDIARMVDGATDTYLTPKPAWRERKEAHLDHLRSADESTIRVVAADKVHNGRALLTDLSLHGLEYWALFNAPPAEQLWYFESMAEIIAERLPGRLSHELSRIVRELRAYVPEEAC